MVMLFRHAQSTWNAYGDISRDSSITESGREMAKLLKGNYDLVICSPLKRARQTLDATNIVYGNIMFSELCREIKDGNPVNLYNGESTENDPETEEQIVQRIEDFKNYVKSLLPTYPNIAVITHFCFLERLTGYKFENCHYYNYNV